MLENGGDSTTKAHHWVIAVFCQKLESARPGAAPFLVPAGSLNAATCQCRCQSARAPTKGALRVSGGECAI